MANSNIPLEKRIRPFLIAFIVLPISVLLNIKVWLVKTFLRHENDPNQHDNRVERIVQHMKTLAKDKVPINLRTDRDSNDSHSLRITKKSQANTVKLRDLNCILNLDLVRAVIRVEPGVTVGEVTSYLVARNLQLEGKHQSNFVSPPD
jgi:hypothetical protein